MQMARGYCLYWKQEKYRSNCYFDRGHAIVVYYLYRLSKLTDKPQRGDGRQAGASEVPLGTSADTVFFRHVKSLSSFF